MAKKIIGGKNPFASALVAAVNEQREKHQKPRVSSKNPITRDELLDSIVHAEQVINAAEILLTVKDQEVLQDDLDEIPF